MRDEFLGVSDELWAAQQRRRAGQGRAERGLASTESHERAGVDHGQADAAETRTEPKTGTVFEYLFNRNPLRIYPDRILGLDENLIEGTPNLRRASLTNATLFGGPLVRRCLESAPLVGDRLHVIVDTKVSMLMPGWLPAIPGWHTDGVPRGRSLDPAGSGAPSMREQQEQSESGYFPRYHTIIVGNDCPTEFLKQSLKLALRHGESEDLYSEMTRLVDEGGHVVYAPRPGEWVSWDWWNIHRATEAEDRGWRLLIRVTESDTISPAESGFIRAQNQVYVPKEFGW